MKRVTTSLFTLTVATAIGCGPSDEAAEVSDTSTTSSSFSTLPSSSINSRESAGDSESADADGTGGAEEVEVCPGPDEHEPNNEFTEAAVVVLENGQGKTRAGVTDLDPDLFAFDAPRADPVSVEATYTTPLGQFADLSMFVYTAAGVELGRHQVPRKELSETMRVNFISQGKGMPHYVRIESDSPVCVPYVLDVDAKVCTDEYEDNDTIKQASLVPIDPAVPTQLPGEPTIIAGDDDFYEFQTVGTDPIIVQSIYTPPSGDTTDLSLYVTDAVGAEIGKHTLKRTEPTEKMRVRFMPDKPNSVYRVRLSSNGERCLGYSLEITPRACSDAFEDNESFESAQLLPAAQQNATITDVDEDYFRIESMGATGTCTVSYTVDEQSPEDLSMFLYSTTQTLIGSHEEERSGAMENMVVHWNAGENPAFVRVSARHHSCTPYRIECRAD